MTPTLDSHQETILEELMQNSFGAQYLYVPQRYLRGSGNDQPCDLAWFGNGVLVLFYLTSGKKSLEKQDEHNLKQARRWRRYWAQKPDQPLIGINRFGDQLNVTSKDVQLMVSISVVSHRSGIAFHDLNNKKQLGYTCTIPDQLIHAVSAFHGTVIDLLGIILSYSQNFRRHVVRHTATGPDRLSLIVEKQTQKIVNALKSGGHEDDKARADFDFVYKILDLNRLPASVGEKLLASATGREQTATFFCDMSALDYIMVAKAALAAIAQTNGGKLSITTMTTGLHLDWVIFATSIRARNMVNQFEESQKSIASLNKGHLPQIIYGYDLEGAEYRSPMMYCLPPERKSIQAQELVRATIHRLLSLRN